MKYSIKSVCLLWKYLMPGKRFHSSVKFHFVMPVISVRKKPTPQVKYLGVTKFKRKLNCRTNMRKPTEKLNTVIFAFKKRYGMN